MNINYIIHVNNLVQATINHKSSKTHGCSLLKQTWGSFTPDLAQHGA